MLLPLPWVCVGGSAVANRSSRDPGLGQPPASTSSAPSDFLRGLLMHNFDTTIDGEINPTRKVHENKRMIWTLQSCFGL